MADGKNANLLHFVETRGEELRIADRVAYKHNIRAYDDLYEVVSKDDRGEKLDNSDLLKLMLGIRDSNMAEDLNAYGKRGKAEHALENHAIGEVNGICKTYNLPQLGTLGDCCESARPNLPQHSRGGSALQK